MDQERWRRAEELFHAALDRATEERKAFLDAACGGDHELRRQVEVLVSKDEHAGSIWEKPALEDVTVTMPLRESLVGRLYRPISARFYAAGSLRASARILVNRLESRPRCLRTWLSGSVRRNISRTWWAAMIESSTPVKPERAEVTGVFG